MRPTDKTRKLNRDPFDALSIPNYVIKKGPSHGARRGNTERQRINHAAHVAAKRQIKRDITRFWHDFKIVQLTERHRSRLDGAKNSAHATTQIQKKTIHTRLQQKSVKDVKTVGYWYSTAKGENGPMNQREDYAEAIRIKDRLYEESGEGNTKIHRSKQVGQRENQPFS